MSLPTRIASASFIGTDGRSCGGRRLFFWHPLSRNISARIQEKAKNLVVLKAARSLPGYALDFHLHRMNAAFGQFLQTSTPAHRSHKP
jgi:hypothetical protein